MTLDMTRRAPQAGANSIDSPISRALVVLLIAIVLVGFAKNFYLRAWLGTRPLIVTAWVHGIVMTAWLALFAGQVSLIGRNRADLHRRLGQWTAWLAVVVV